MPYIQNAQISKTIYEKLTLYPLKGKLELSALTYIQLLTHLLEVFIQGSAQDKHSSFAVDNSRVNAICSEFFESLMQNIESRRIKFAVIKTHLLKMLHHLATLIKRGDSILQIQMLNLIKNFIVSTKECEQEMKNNEKKDIMDIYGSDYFIPNFLNGLKHSSVFFTKSRYLNAIVISIYTLSDMLDKHTLTERVNQIINTIMNLVQKHELKPDKPQQSRAPSANMEDDYDKFLELQQQQLYRVSNVYQNSQYFQSSSKWKRQENFEATDIIKLSGNSDIIQRNNLALMTSSSGEDFEEVMNLSNSIRAIIAFYFRFKDEIKADLE